MPTVRVIVDTLIAEVDVTVPFHPSLGNPTEGLDAALDEATRRVRAAFTPGEPQPREPAPDADVLELPNDPSFFTHPPEGRP